MNRLRPILLALALVLVALPATAAARQKPPAPPAGGSYIVVYERAAVDSVDRATDARERRRGFRARLRFRRAIEGFAARLTPDQVRALRADPDVKAVVPDRPVRALAAQPIAIGEVLPSGVRRIDAAEPAAAPPWVREASDSGVAVIDTGVDLDHPDLNVADGVNCITPGTSADDDEGHGTHVAGTIGAENDAAGVTGVAPGTRVHAVKVLDADGAGATSTIVCGIDWVIANASARGIRVMNMSLGGPGNNDRNCGRTAGNEDPLHDAICRAASAGILAVVAAGNDRWDISENPTDVPSTYDEVLTVTAMSDGDGAPGGATKPTCRTDSNDDAFAAFSNFTRTERDKAHTIAAPGVCIRSTTPGGYGTSSGTSMASPHAAAVAALCIGEAGAAGPCAGLTPAQIIQRLRDDAAAYRAANPGYGFTGDPVAPLSNGNYYGYLIRPNPAAPQTELTAAPTATTADTTPTFEFTSRTRGASFECRVDGGDWAACSSPYTTGELPEGPHRVDVRAVDVAGARDASPAGDSFTVDVPDPQPPQSQPPAIRAEDPPPPAPDTTPPSARIGAASRQRISTVSRKGLRVSVACAEACRIDARLLVGSLTAGKKGGALAPGRRTLTLRLTSTARRRLARRRSVLVRVQVVVTDAAGNARTVKKSVRLVR